MILEVTAVSIIGGFICLDRTCLQIMVSRPIVVAPLTGLCLGDPLAGLTVGAFMELLWIDKPQIGIYVPPNDSLISVAIISSLLLSGTTFADHRREMTAFAFLTLISLGQLTRKMDSALIQANERLSETALQAAAKGDVEEIGRQHVKAILRTLLAYVLFLFISMLAGILAIRCLFPLLPDYLIKALNLMYHLIPAVLIAIALNAIKLRRMVPVFCAVFLAIMLIVEFINAY